MLGSPEDRQRLRDATEIMLGHVVGTPGTPYDAQDDETAGEEDPGDCAELNAIGATLRDVC